MRIIMYILKVFVNTVIFCQAKVLVHILDVLYYNFSFVEFLINNSELYKDEYYDEFSDDNRDWQLIFANREYKLWKLKCGHYFI